MSNGRCRMHGGKSTGPKTKAGIDKIAAAQFKHGMYTKAFQAELKQFKSKAKLLDKDMQKIVNLL